MLLLDIPYSRAETTLTMTHSKPRHQPKHSPFTIKLYYAIAEHEGNHAFRYAVHFGRRGPSWIHKVSNNI